MTINKKWFLLGLLSITIVALYGTLMRYKIAYDLPFFVQKHLLHAHSHFAFTGWVTHLLFLGMFLFISPKLPIKRRRTYHWIIGLNLISAFGMLVFFTLQGYDVLSIIFSTLSIVVVLLYSFCFIKDVWKISTTKNFKLWATAGLLFNILSSLGPFSLAYIMANKVMDISLVNASIYYFLHFQYNGWFFFGSMALVISMVPSLPSLAGYLKIFVATTLITYVLSILWLKIPDWLYWVSVVAASLQLVTWFVLIYKQHRFIKSKINIRKPLIRLLFYSSMIAISIKFVLQELSVIPELSHLAFGVRPIIIGYLHLILLGGFTLFLIAFSFYKGYIRINRIAKIGTLVFFVGVCLNELVLGVQGLAAFKYIVIPKVNLMLLLAAILLLLGAGSLFISQLFYPTNSIGASKNNTDKPAIENKNSKRIPLTRISKEEKALVN